MTKAINETERPLRTLVVLQTHYMDQALVRFFRNMTVGLPPGYEAMVLIHVRPGTPKPSLASAVPHHFVTTPEIRNPAYINKSGIGLEWHIWKGGHTDLCALHLFQQCPQFDRYWFVEYDVRFSGRWRDFFTAFDGDRADLLTTTLRRATADPHWMHWPTLLPPNSVEHLGTEDRICGFMPVFRVSRQAMEAMDRAYQYGWTGHCEATWPTILNHAGLRIQDIGGDGEFVAPGNRNRFYTNTLGDKELAPGSMVFRPTRLRPGRQRNHLWHPIKPPFTKLREDMRRAMPAWIKRTRRRLVALRRHQLEA